MRRRKRRRRRLRPLRLLFVLAIVLLAVAGLCWAGSLLFGGEDVPVSTGPAPVEPQAPALPDERIVETPQLYSEWAYLIRREDGAVLFSKGAEERMYPASLTKVMTALVALEQMAPQESAAARLHYLLPGYTVPESIFEELYRQSASLAGFEPGERVSGRDLIAGVLLPSGGDASLTLAIRLMGSEEQFVARMNERAAELGMTGTHFTNVCGLHDEQHYSTARDMALLLDAALENEAFREIFSLREYRVAATDRRPDGFVMESTLKRGLTADYFPGGRILGGKTGTTTPAGQCLVSLAEKNGREYILVTTGARPQEEMEELASGVDARALYGAIPEQRAEAEAAA